MSGGDQKRDAAPLTDSTKLDQRKNGPSEERKAGRETDEGKAGERERPKRFKAFFVHVVTHPIELFTALIFVINTVYVIVSVCQLRILGRTLEGDQRAWVLYSSATPKSARPIELIPGKKADAVVLVENMGKSPAQGVRTLTVVWTLPAAATEPPPEDIIYGSSRPSGPSSVMPLGPRQTLELVFKDITVTQAQVDAIKMGIMILYLFARIDYADQFNEHRFTRLCFLYNEDMAKVGKVAVCSFYNHAE